MYADGNITHNPESSSPTPLEFETPLKTSTCKNNDHISITPGIDFSNCIVYVKSLDSKPGIETVSYDSSGCWQKGPLTSGVDN